MAGKTLIFPGGMPGALAHAALCRSTGQSVVGASSLAYDPNGAQYREWTTLPFLTAPAFDAAFDQVVADHGVTQIFTPHPIVWRHLQDRAAAGALAAALLPLPAESDAEPYRHALAASDLPPLPLPLSSARAPLPAMETAALLCHTERIAGMCDTDKTRALIEIFRSLPVGDVVEIGSWWGKSAFILLRLAQLHAIGSLLCIDPWTRENSIQHDSSGLVDQLVATIDPDEAHQIFTLNLLPYAKGDINYLRMPAHQAIGAFGTAPVIETAEFGSTAYTGRIAALHIDGNHAYDLVKADILDWTPRVLAGGWIIIDDYVWPWGDGPKRAGDEFLAEHGTKIDCCFVMGTALFVQLVEAL
ncbi:class I SAM-dependent methyltransferase [Roseomonas aeriglobus]|nr:class I SAM-dependent methyltransferase [Roseomonas aeriglobus]